MQPLDSSAISTSGSSKTWTWKLSATLAPQIRENHKNVLKVGPRRLPKCTLKSIKIDIWPPVCPPGVPLDPRITKMVSQVPKMEPQGLKMTVFRIKSDPFQQSTSQQLLADRRPAAGGEALECAAAWLSHAFNGVSDQSCSRTSVMLTLCLEKNRTLSLTLSYAFFLFRV